MDLKEVDILGPDIETHWYYRAKAQAMSRLLGSRTYAQVLDVGAGSGYFSNYLLKHTAVAGACCVDTSYAADSTRRVCDKLVRYCRSTGPIDADLVLLMDVLEHVDDDLGLLADYVGKVPSGATFLITVPAFQRLWSDHDEFLEHKRRYTVPQIESIAQQAGLRIGTGAYYFGAVLPFAAGSRLLSKWLDSDRSPRSQLRKDSALVSGIFAALCALELPLMRANRLGGLSAFCLARKP